MSKKPAKQTNSDAALYDMVKRKNELWRECEGLQKREIGLAEKEAQHRRLVHQACDLEWQIARCDVHTLVGYETKVLEINRATFEDEDLVEIAWQLGRYAARLGITEPPKLETGPTHNRPSAYVPRRSGKRKTDAAVTAP